MDHNEILAPCSLCKTVDILRPYGDQDALICFDCAREQEERVRAYVLEAAERLRKLG